MPHERQRDDGEVRRFSLCSIRTMPGDRLRDRLLCEAEDHLAYHPCEADGAGRGQAYSTDSLEDEPVAREDGPGKGGGLLVTTIGVELEDRGHHPWLCFPVERESLFEGLELTGSHGAESHVATVVRTPIRLDDFLL